MAYSVYNSFKIDKKILSRFPVFKDRSTNLDKPSEEKALAFLFPHFSDSILKAAPIKLILLPRVLGCGRTSISPAGKAEAIKALAPSTIFQLTGEGQIAFKQILTLCSLPVRFLNLGRDFEEIPKLIKSTLKEFDGQQ